MIVLGKQIFNKSLASAILIYFSHSILDVPDLFDFPLIVIKASRSVILILTDLSGSYDRLPCAILKHFIECFLNSLSTKNFLSNYAPINT